MKNENNLAELIEKNLADDLKTLINRVIAVASSDNIHAYLVGGIVRDLLLGKPNFDLDFVVEGDAIQLAKELIKPTGGKLITHVRFNTAKIKLDRWNIDLATARSETYSRPGALPIVKPGTLEQDLFRRDFTINSMAVRLTPEARRGELIDPYKGYADLHHKLVRILHEKSFIDDATRIWRAIRYEQRFDFHIESETLRLLERDISMLATISGDRIRHELELVLKEEYPEKMLSRAWVLKALGKVHRSLRGDTWLTEKFSSARAVSYHEPEISRLYMALLVYRLKEQEIEELVSFLRPERQMTVILRDCSQLKSSIKELRQKLQPSDIYSILDGYHQTAILANYVAADSIKAKNNIKLYLDKLRRVKTTLTGNELRTFGVPQGAEMQEVLILLHNARLNGEAETRQGEEMLVREWLKDQHSH
jgi:tRNA nucleotidyltransferase (CCA-adding enzyme)